MTSRELVRNKEFNPEMLVLAREARQLSQSELAKQASLSQAEVSRYENGTRVPSDEHIDLLANALGFLRTHFFQWDRPYGLGSNGLYHRKQRTLSVKELNRLIAQINLFRFFAQRLLRSVDIEFYETIPQFTPEDFNGDIEAIAENVRASWKLPAGPIHDLVGVLENAGCIIHRINFGNRKIDALAQWNPPSPPIILVNSEAPGDRLRFTLAHELGHLVMHDYPKTNDIEKEADQFASAFLMPKRDIISDLQGMTLQQLSQLKPYWRVSMAALIRRAYDLQTITERQYRSFNTKLNQYGYHFNESISIAQEQPTLLQEMIDAHLQELHYTLQDISEFAHIGVKEFEEVYMSRGKILRLLRK